MRAPRRWKRDKRGAPLCLSLPEPHLLAPHRRSVGASPRARSPLVPARGSRESAARAREDDKAWTAQLHASPPRGGVRLLVPRQSRRDRDDELREDKAREESTQDVLDIEESIVGDDPGTVKDRRSPRTTSEISGAPGGGRGGRSVGRRRGLAPVRAEGAWREDRPRLSGSRHAR